MKRIEKAHALVIGIAEYRNIRGLGPSVINDAEAIAAILMSEACGYPPENVRTLLDGEATRDAIRAELAGLAERTDGGSTAFIYFSGHGDRTKTTPAEEYLLPVDSDCASDQSLAASGISGEEFSHA